MEQLFQTLYLQACERLQTARRWTTLAIGIALVLHFTLLFEMAQLKGRLARLPPQLGELNRVSSANAQLSAALLALERATVGEAARALVDLRSGLTNDFRLLGREIGAIYSGGPVPPPMTPLPRRLGIQGFPPMQGLPPVSQWDPSAGAMPEAVTLWIAPIPEALYEPLRKAQLNGELTAQLLIPHVRKRLIEPRFAELNDRWSRHQRAIGVAATNALTAWTAAQPELSPWVGRQPALWERFAQVPAQIQTLVSNATRLTFSAPVDNDWWRTLSGKDGYQERATEDSALALAEAMQTREVTAALQREIDGAQQTLREAQAKLEDQVARLQAELAAQQAKLSALARPLQVVALESDLLLTRLPFYVGLLIAIGIWWPAAAAVQVRQAGASLEAAHRAAAGGPIPALPQEKPGLRREVIALGALLWLGAAIATAAMAERGFSSQAISSSVIGVTLALAAVLFRPGRSGGPATKVD